MHYYYYYYNYYYCCSYIIDTLIIPGGGTLRGVTRLAIYPPGIDVNQRESVKIDENQWKSMKPNGLRGGFW